MLTTFVDKTLLVLTLLGPQLSPAIHRMDVLNPSTGGSAFQVVDSLVTEAPANQEPAVNAGSNQNITLPASATLSGTASDDGLPAGSTQTTTWSKVSGPGTVAFANAKALSTMASFSAAGTYVLRLTVSDSALSRSADVTIVV